MSQPALKEAPTATGVFISTVTALKNGAFAAELDDAIRTVTEAVNRTQLKGAVKITLQIVPNGVGLGEEPIYAVVPDCDPIVPKKAEKGQVFFADENYNLIRRNPKQMEAPGLTAVETLSPSGVSRARAAVNS